MAGEGPTPGKARGPTSKTSKWLLGADARQDRGPTSERRVLGPPPGGMVKLYSPSKPLAWTMQRFARPLKGGMVKLYSPSGGHAV